MAEQYLNKEGVRTLWAAVKGKISTAQTTVENEFVNGTKKAKYAQQADNIGGAALSGLVQSIKVGSKTFSPKNSVVTLDDYALSTHTHTFASLTNKPTTISGYGITDAYTKTETDKKYAPKSTTLSGYGITDAYTKTESDGKYATKTDSDTKYQPKGSYATLDGNGKVPSPQLPSYVDDVIEGYYSNGKFYSDSAKTKEITGEGGKIYTDLASNKTYRWGGTSWVEISASLAIGETAGTAYDGAKGAKNANDIANLKISEKANHDRITNLESGKADKATTLSGYGITDAYTKTETNERYVTLSGDQTISGSKTFSSAINASNDIFCDKEISAKLFRVGDIFESYGMTSFTIIDGETLLYWQIRNNNANATNNKLHFPSAFTTRGSTDVELTIATTSDLPTAISMSDLNAILV